MVNIANKLHKYLSEAKEMSMKDVMDKIDDGYWEAEEDVKKGKHVTIRDTKTKKRMTIYIKEALDDSELDIIEEAHKIPTDIGIGDKIKTEHGYIKITDINLGSFHLNHPIVYIYYDYDVEIDGKNRKGSEKNPVDTFKKNFFNL